jgi:ribonuclease HI
MGKRKNKYYAVAIGRKPGIYNKWYGENGAEIQVKGFPNARFQGFPTKKGAEAYLKENNPTDVSTLNKSKRTSPNKAKVIIYTDGGCKNNPGPGGYGVVLKNAKKRKELSGGFRLTTNNRMEIMACIVGLRALKRKLSVVMHSDSKYVVYGINKGWAKRWKANGWMRNKTDRAENADLWEQLLELCGKHNVTFKWVKGHAGVPENERCDHLAVKAASKRGLAPDKVYERKTKGSRLHF